MEEMKKRDWKKLLNLIDGKIYQLQCVAASAAHHKNESLESLANNAAKEWEEIMGKIKKGLEK